MRTLWVEQMLVNGVEMSLVFRRILGPLVLGWAPNHFVLGAQLALGEKRLVCIPDCLSCLSVQLLNPFHSDGFSQKHCCNKHGIVHFVFEGVTGQNFLS